MIAPCASGSMSPGSRIRTPEISTSKVTLELLGTEPAWINLAGHSTRQESSPILRTSPI